MVFVSNIFDLAFYNTPAGATCYCEQLIYPTDLTLQAPLPGVNTSNITAEITVYSPDGTEPYEDASTYFETYVATFNGQIYFNIRLKAFSPAMCEYKCWILRVEIRRGVTLIFDKYTERYCQNECCDVPRGITIDVEGGTSVGPVTESGATEPVIPMGTCGSPLIRITATFPCFDNFNNEWYGIPAGQSWGLTKVTNIEGLINQRPREIVRNVSFNCNLERSESFIPYLVRANELVPVWKMNELEVMFHAPDLSISDFITSRPYQFAGGPIVTQPYSCWELFKLETTVQTCTVRQTFGCNDSCDDSETVYFAIPARYQGGTFYSESRMAVATDIDELADYFEGQAGVSSATDVTGEYSGYDHVLEVQGRGYIPNSIYFDFPIARNRVFGLSSISNLITSCEMFDAGAITVTEQVCEDFDLGPIYVSDQPSETITILDYNDWEITLQDVTRAGDTIYMDIESTNTVIAPGEEPTEFVNEIIGRVTPAGWPRNPVSISHEDNENVPVNGLLTIDTQGTIRYTGQATTETEEVTKIAINNIYYGA